MGLLVKMAICIWEFFNYLNVEVTLFSVAIVSLHSLPLLLIYALFMLQFRPLNSNQVPVRKLITK